MCVCVCVHMQMPSMLQAVAYSDVLAMRHQTQFLWETYFSSIRTIVHTTLEVCRDLDLCTCEP